MQKKVLTYMDLGINGKCTPEHMVNGTEQMAPEHMTNCQDFPMVVENRYKLRSHVQSLNEMLMSNQTDHKYSFPPLWGEVMQSPVLEVNKQHSRRNEKRKKELS